MNPPKIVSDICAAGGYSAPGAEERTMEQGRVERRLAAILAADVAGYLRLIGIDEVGTLSRLKAVRMDLVDPKIAEHRGRIVKTTGDGLLVVFSSVVDALLCATKIQHVDRWSRAKRADR